MIERKENTGGDSPVSRRRSRSWPRLGRIIVCVLVVWLTAACGGDSFHSLAEGDCTEGNPQLEGALGVIDCADFDRASSHHYVVRAVMDAADSGVNYRMGSLGVEDRDRVVCFGRY